MIKGVLAWGVFLFAALFSVYTSAAPSTPKNVVASVSNNNYITIRWGSVSGAAKYIREAKVGTGSWINPNEYVSTSVSFSNARPGQYQYRVKACDSSSCSGWQYSNTITVFDSPTAPESVSAIIKNLDDLEIRWSKVLGADYYIREASVNSEAWINPRKYSGTFVSFNNAELNKYQYRVKACNYLGCSKWTYSNIINVVRPPSVPSQVIAEIQNGNDVNISWSKVSGASYYVREAQVGNGNWIHPYEYTGTSVSFSNALPNQYRYRVKSCNTSGCSDWKYSNTVTVLAIPLVPSSVSATIKNLDVVEVSWSTAFGADYYIREARVNSGAWINPRKYSGTFASFTDAVPNQYQYRVRACNNRGCSNWAYSNTVSVIISANAPSHVTAVIKNENDIYLSWSSVDRAAYYIREVKINDSSWSTPKEYLDTQDIFKDLSPNKYRYRLKACNTHGCSSWSYSEIVTIISLPPNPEKVTAVLKGENDIEVTWSIVQGALSYVLEARVDNGKWSNRKVYTINIATNDILEPGLYSYRAKACNNDGCSGWSYSNEVSVKEKPIQSKGVVFIHTDLLGNPVAESSQ
ncbi:fibronectin type III domain-containing protein [Pseudoalteromonas sp. CO348]|uniref:fibronectin type III domain-containing protein n=1 Tax=unclassified Pseudoalteromonas TaxID=194690 RepID=UPI001023BF4B|nr:MULTISPECIES: fibronectin type III domain-containing protein [unclassified Pseudoalteromonas]MCG7540143.1 fibronectin type III domain-containing protein [Pseudoalteromonas sp. OF7H-1]RZG05101.1 fibronectin type III domain-containing protein [Pseudoalteromonas sp. CO348]